jgi:hypothetical protein
MTIGAEEIRRLRALGASEEELAGYEESTRKELSEKGASPVEIDNYFGLGPANFQSVANRMNAVPLEDAGEAGDPAEERDLTAKEAIISGYQHSLTGLSTRGELPDFAPGEEEDLTDMILFSLAQAVGDIPVSLPAFITGAKVGAVASAPVGALFGPVGAGITAVVGAGVAGGAAAGFVAEDLRLAYMDFYEDNEGRDVGPREFLTGMVTAAMSKEVLKEAGKAAVIEGALGVVGPVARGFTGPVSSTIARELVVTSSEVTAAATFIAGMEGRFPTQRDFALAVGPIVAFKSGEVAFRRATKTGRLTRTAEEKLFKDIEKRVRDIYRRTGESPIDVAKRAQDDPVLRQELLTGEDQISPQRAEMDVNVVDTLGGTDVETITINHPDIDPLNIKDIDPTSSAQSQAVAAAKPGTPGVPLPKKVASPSKELVVVSDAEAAMQRANGLELDAPAPKDPPKDTPEGEAPLTVAQAQLKMSEMTAREKRKMYWIDDFRYDFVTDLQFAVVIPERAFRSETGNKLSIEQNPGQLVRLAYGAHGRADLELKVGIFNDAGEKIGPGLTEILDQIPKADRSAFNNYLVSRRTLEKEGQGFDTGMPTDAAKVLVPVGDAKPAFVKASKEIQIWQNSAISLLVDSGMLNQKRADSIIDLNKDFVPWFRLMFEGGRGPAGTTSRGIPVRNAVKKFKGTKKDIPIRNIFESMIKNRYSLTQLAMNNQARTRFVTFNDKLSPENQFITRIGPMTIKIRDLGLDAEFKAFLDDNGMDPSDAPDFAAYNTLTKFLDPDEFIVYEGGDPIRYRADDPNLVRSLMSLDAGSQSAVLRALAVPATLMRSGTVLTVDFMTRATIRDQMSAPLINAFKTVPVIDAAIGGAMIALGPERSKKFAQQIMEGGMNAALLDADKNVLSRGILEDAAVGEHTVRSAWNTAITPWRYASFAATFLDNATRSGQFSRSLKGKVPEGPLDIATAKQVAALRGRDINLDFSGKMGARIRGLNIHSSFLGAYINGLDRTYAAFKNHPRRTFMFGLASITLPAILTWLSSRDEDWYKNLEEWEKAMFFQFRYGGTEEDPKVFTPPMPPVFGVLFGYVPIKMLEAFVEDDPEAIDEIKEKLFEEVVSGPLKTAIPRVTIPFLEISSNHSWFTNKQLVGTWLEKNALPEYRYTPYTTEIAKKMAKLLGALGQPLGERFRTPKAVEHIVQQWTGTIGIAALRLVDGALQDIGVLPNQVRPTDTNIPLLRSFWFRHADGRGQVDQFFRNVDKINQISGSIVSLQKEGRFDEAINLFSAYGHMTIDLDDQVRSVSNLYNVSRGIAMMPPLYPEGSTRAEKRQLDKHFADEKRQQTDALNLQIIAITGAMNDAFTEARKLAKVLQEEAGEEQ